VEIPTSAAERDFTVASLLDGSADRKLRLFGARALLPLGIEERIRILLSCHGDSDQEIASEAAASLSKISADEWLSFLDLGEISGSDVATIAATAPDPAVLERLVRHPSTPDSVLVRIAREAPASVLEALVVNQKRLLAHPAIIDAAEGNRALPADSRRLLAEIREEFFEKEARRRAHADAVPVKTAEPVDSEAVAEPEVSPSAAAEPGETEEEKQRRMAINQRIAYMTASEKIDTALKGSREERRILITDVNKSVWEAVLRCPYLTDVELEAFASMRNVDEGVFRKMVLKPEWMRKYPVVHRMVNNPVVPTEISMALVKFLRMRDLKMTMSDKNLPEAVRVTARKIYLVRRT
jgi:hypothetical protein